MYLVFLWHLYLCSVQALGLSLLVNCDGIQMVGDATACAQSPAFEKYRGNNSYKGYVIR